MLDLALLALATDMKVRSKGKKNRVVQLVR